MARYNFSRVPGQPAFRCEPIVDSAQWMKIQTGAGGLSYGLIRGRSGITSHTIGHPGAEYGEDLHAMIRWCETEFGARDRVLRPSGRWSFKYGKKVFLRGPGICAEIPRGTFYFSDETAAALFRLRWT